MHTEFPICRGRLFLLKGIFHPKKTAVVSRNIHVYIIYKRRIRKYLHAEEMNSLAQPFHTLNINLPVLSSYLNVVWPLTTDRHE